MKPFPRNSTVETGTKNVTFSCGSDVGPYFVFWIFKPYGSNQTRLIAYGKRLLDNQYASYVSFDNKTNNLVVKVASAVVAGVYSCSDSVGEARAQLSIGVYFFIGFTSVASCLIMCSVTRYADYRSPAD